MGILARTAITGDFVNTENVKLIRKNNSEPVTAYQDAVIYFNMMGDGILSGAYNELGYTYSGTTFSLKSGLILFGGRLIEISKNQTVDLNVSNLGTSEFYVQLLLIINEDDSKSDVGIVTSSTSSNQTGADVIKSTSGTFYYDLYKVNPVTTNVELLAHKFKPGEAKNCIHLMLQKGSYFNDNPYEDVFSQDENGKLIGVNYAKEAEVTAEAQGFVGGNKNSIMTDPFYFNSRGVYALQGCYILKDQDVTCRKDTMYTYNFYEDAKKALNYKNGRLIGKAMLVFYSDDSHTNPVLINDTIDNGSAIDCVEFGDSFRFYDKEQNGQIIKEIECGIDTQNKKISFKMASESDGSEKTLNNFSLFVVFIGDMLNGANN